MTGTRYSETEKQRITNAYRAGGLRAAYAVAPHRAQPGVRDLLVRLGVHKPRFTKHDWTTDEERTAVKMWEARATAKEIAKAINHPFGSVLVHLAAHRKRLGLKPRTRAPKMTPGQKLFVGRTMEHALDHICAQTGKTRGAAKNEALRYLMSFARLAKAKRIEDVGGMRDDSHVRDFGTPRSEHKHSRAPRKRAA